jgi:light-regulated signal transduction histidine kinase (bacteriophytochrome)
MSEPRNPSPLPWAGQPYSVKRHGVDIANCDSEPVETPGCVQAHGGMLVLRLSDLTILQASENTDRLLDRAAPSLLGCPVADALGSDAATRLRAFLDQEPTENYPLYVLTLPARGAVSALDVCVHTFEGLAIVELESTRREAVEPDYYALVKKTVARLPTARTLKEFCDIAVEDVRAVTGFDRVMVYKFHADGHGEVFAETKREDLSAWLGLHYPAEDIPRPAREVFRKVWVRPLPDVGGELAELVPLANPDTGKPLAMTYCALRGASVMYTEYLQNMGVTAGLTMPIRRENELWGLIACHHYTGPKHISPAVRAACEFLAQIISLQNRAAEENEHLAYRLKLESVHHHLVAAAAREGGLEAMIQGSPTLLDGMDATGAAVYHRDRWWLLGKTPTAAQLDDFTAWLERRSEFGSGRWMYVTDSLVRDYPDGAAFADVASGVLALPLTSNLRNALMWFRPETLQTVNWGGNPHEKPKVPGPHGPRLTPRRSFELFSESVHQRSLPWRSVEIDAARSLRTLLMDLVIIRAEHNEDLARSNEELDAFAALASHDLKEPLRGIYKYARQFGEASALDDVGRQRLEGVLRLALRMDTILDSLLHFSRLGRANLEIEDVSLDEVVSEALEMVDVRRLENPSEIAVPRPMPRVRCDRVQCREIFTNLLTNALKYNDRPMRKVEVGFLRPDEDEERRGFPVEVASALAFYVRDNGIGIAEAHFKQVFKMFKRLHGRDAYGGGAGAGLTIVKKLVERHHGQVWLDSTLGEGTTVYFTLPNQEGIR